MTQPKRVILDDDGLDIVEPIFGGMVLIDASEMVNNYLEVVARQEYVRAVASGQPASEAYLHVKRRLEAR